MGGPVPGTFWLLSSVSGSSGCLPCELDFPASSQLTSTEQVDSPAAHQEVHHLAEEAHREGDGEAAGLLR